MAGDACLEHYSAHCLCCWREDGDVAQPARSIGGIRVGDIWWKEDRASPQGPVGGFITPRAAPVFYFSQQECAKKKKKKHKANWSQVL